MASASATERMTQLSEGIGLLYDSLLENDCLPSTLNAWSRSLDATGSAFLQCDARKELEGSASHGYDPEAIRLWIEQYQFIDPTRAPTLDGAVGMWIWDDALLSPEHSAAPEFVHDFGLRYGLRYLRGGKMHEDPAGSTVLTFHKPQDARSFDDHWTRHVLTTLQSHLARYVRLSRELQHFKFRLHAGLAALDNLGIGVAVVCRTGLLHYLNRVAEEVIQARGSLRTQFSRLTGSTPQISDQLRRAMRLAFGSPRQAAAFSSCGHDGKRIQVRIVPMDERHEFISRIPAREPLALVYFADPTWGVSAPALQMLFGLSRAEAELAELLVGGLSPEKCADARGTSLSTVRTQIRNLYAKSDARSLSEFVTLARGLPPTRSPRT